MVSPVMGLEVSGRRGRARYEVRRKRWAKCRHRDRTNLGTATIAELTARRNSVAGT